MGYGIALNADHIPWNLIPLNIFKNNSNNYGTLDNNQSSNLAVTPQQSTQNTGSNQQTTKNNNVKTQDNGNSAPTSNSDNGGISSNDAKSIADGYIKEPGASSGTPKNVDIGGKDTYVVPVESNGSTVGEIHIDPNTGENVGGAGGAP
jgi:hypothetical protein